MRSVDLDGRPENLDVVASSGAVLAVAPAVGQFVKGHDNSESREDAEDKCEAGHGSIVLISEQYRKEQEALHAKGNYGTASLQFGQIVSHLLDATESDTILDYGCGSMRNLLKVLETSREVRYLGYDPAVPEYSAKEPCDFVTCIDVLEHIEPELLDNVLDDLFMLTKRWGFFTVHTGPAAKTLSDGRNAHLIQRPASWWLPKFLQRWELQKFDATRSGFNVLLRVQ